MLKRIETQYLRLACADGIDIVCESVSLTDNRCAQHAIYSMFTLTQQMHVVVVYSMSLLLVGAIKYRVSHHVTNTCRPTKNPVK